MNLTIEIKKLKIAVIVGTNPQERKKKQHILLDISFDYDAAKAIANDDVKQAIDYERLTQVIIREASKTQFFLIEKLADAILSLIMKEPGIQKASVKVCKPKAIKNTESVSVKLEREKWTPLENQVLNRAMSERKL